MTTKVKTIGFGASEDFGAHTFQVEIPSAKNEDIRIIEHFGLTGGYGGRPFEQVRAILPRKVWLAIAEAAKRDFNIRLKAHKLLTSRWKTGPNKIDQLLGKELCVLAWAAENATGDEWAVICSKWAALRPEERWWLFSMTAAETGLAENSGCGWRKALYYALSGEPTKRVLPKHRAHDSDLEKLPLFAWRASP